jgi:hypothetical protein
MTQLTTDGYSGKATSLQRNRFYPRKLMEVRHWQAEQTYHRRSRELLTRLGLGAGVLCGLEVTRNADGTLAITSGVGVDGCGRIVIVPHDIDVDLSTLTDDCGHPTGETADAGKVGVYLCFHECGTDLVPMPPELCDDEVACVASMTREAFSVSVMRTLPSPPHLAAEVCDEVFAPHQDGDQDRHQLLDSLDPRRCERDADCIPLAVVDLAGAVDDTSVDTSFRVVIRSNRQLLDLLLCLAERVDDCCGNQPPVITPPRVTGLWPWPGDDGTGLTELTDNLRLEMAFDHDMAEQGLDDPGAWLGVWLLGVRQARRLKVTRASGSLDHVTVPADGDGVAFTIEVEQDWIRPATLIVVMARSTPGGPIHAAGAGQLALDAELAATGLDPGQRDQLWAMPPDGSNDAKLGTVLSKVAAPGMRPWLPTGDGTAGGDLHVVYYPVQVAQPPPLLLRVWPPSGALLNNDTAENADLLARFRNLQQLIIEVSRPLAAAAIADPRAWLRSWTASRDGDFLYALRELALAPGQEGLLPEGSARYSFPITGDIDWNGEILVQLRSTPPLEASSPVDQADEQTLLDADFAGTRLDSQTLFTIWSGGGPDPLPVLDAISSEGVTLGDGVAGGLAHWGFALSSLKQPNELNPRRA